ncbi:hypothetical protein TNCV_752931 [Trichonephila clavipes]|uniref:Uncharacterized protein n=1 Tax=Trichonephila clavipes TaxID=2585209 RepID=A0A8X7BHD0_TRICX|nr:hypothetical protein TNCV_752931 [Trichonephila clavipes]
MPTKPHPKNVQKQATIKKVNSLMLKENPPTKRFIASKLGMSPGTIFCDISFFLLSATEDSPCRGYNAPCQDSKSFRWSDVVVWKEKASSGVILVTRSRLKITRFVVISPRDVL